MIKVSWWFPTGFPFTAKCFLFSAQQIVRGSQETLREHVL